MDSLEQKAIAHPPQHHSLPSPYLLLYLILTAIIAGTGGYIAGQTMKSDLSSTQVVKTNPAISATPLLTKEPYHIVAIPQNRFSCRSYINSILSTNPYVAEGWQTDCYFPWDTNASFQFRDHLECQGVTDENITQYTQNPDDNVPPFTGMHVSLQKDDWIKFTLDFQGNTIARTQESIPFPEPYTIVNDSHDLIQAVRPVTEADEIKAAHPAYHQFITFSKETGQGMEIRQNEGQGAFIGSMLFQCK